MFTTNDSQAYVPATAVLFSTIQTDWRSASAGFSRTIATEVITAPSHTNPPHTMSRPVFIFKRDDARMTTVASRIFVSIPRPKSVMHLVVLDIVRRASNVPICMRTSVRTLPTKASAYEATSVSIGTFTVRLECGNPPVALLQKTDLGRLLLKSRLC